MESLENIAVPSTNGSGNGKSGSLPFLRYGNRKMYDQNSSRYVNISSEVGPALLADLNLEVYEKLGGQLRREISKDMLISYGVIKLEREMKSKSKEQIAVVVEGLLKLIETV